MKITATGNHKITFSATYDLNNVRIEIRDDEKGWKEAKIKRNEYGFELIEKLDNNKEYYFRIVRNAGYSDSELKAQKL